MGKKRKQIKTGHNPIGKVCHWVYCVKCGLVYLRNEATFKAIKAGCDGDREVEDD